MKLVELFVNVRSLVDSILGVVWKFELSSCFFAFNSSSFRPIDNF